jgi:CRISPR type III-A/MTUBE-associated protein Csm6
MRDCYDGSLLHIVRHYRPDAVILYLTAEMCRYQSTDERYTRALELMDIPQDNIQLIERPELTAPHEYDFFYHEFREVLASIREGHEGESPRLLLNVSSGTPAMKSALIVLNALNEFSMEAIQVKTPNAGSNKNKLHDDASVDDQWENNLDNEPDALNRCIIVKPLNLGALIKRETVKEHVLEYDYQAALHVARAQNHAVPKSVTGIIEGCVLRLNLQESKAMGKLGGDLVSKCVYQGKPEIRALFEYLQFLKIRLLRKEYADFCRALTPAVTSLLILALGEQTEWKRERYLKNPDERLDNHELNLEAIKESPELLRAFEPHSSKGPVYVRNYQLVDLFDESCEDDELRFLANYTKELDGKKRNRFAHTIYPVPDDFEKNHRPKKYLENLERFLSLIVEKSSLPPLPPFDSYDLINEEIRRKLDEAPLEVE